MHRKSPLKINSIVNSFMDAMNENVFVLNYEVKVQVCEVWTNDGKFRKINMNEKQKNLRTFSAFKNVLGLISWKERRDLKSGILYCLKDGSPAKVS